MPGEPARIYWDACCFLYYLNKDPKWLPVVEAILEEVFQSDGKIQIVTSVLTKVEVAFTAEEVLKRQLSPDEEGRIHDLLHDTSVVALVEVHELVIDRARRYKREALARGLALRPPDAIHLATASGMRVTAFHTCDAKLLNIGYRTITGLSIMLPAAAQPTLGLT